MSHQIVVLRNWKRDTGDIGFLECIRTQQLATNLAGNAHDGRGIQHRRSNTRDHIGGARPRSSDGNSYSSGGPGVAVGHVSRALFMANQDVMNRTVFESIVGRQDRAARIAEYVRDAFALQAFPENSCPT